MKLVPKGKWAVARLVDVQKSMLQTLDLPDAEKQGVSVIALIDTVGPEFTRAKPGDLVMYLRCQHIVLRNRMHAALIDEDNVLATIECSDDDRTTLKIEVPTFDNGKDLSPIEAALALQ